MNEIANSLTLLKELFWVRAIKNSVQHHPIIDRLKIMKNALDILAKFNGFKCQDYEYEHIKSALGFKIFAFLIF